MSQVNQLQYNDNRVALGRSISAVLSMLKELQSRNKKWPIYYPASPTSQTEEFKLNRRATLAAVESQSHDDFMSESLKRRTSGGFDTLEHKPTQPKPKQEPRLVPPQLANDFNIFKLDFKIGGLNSTELISQLEKTSVASLLDDKIIRAMRHLLSLRERIDDTTSKVLITGDLNAGKSTFCNALLRRKLLPEDQQPCTSVFCEVIDGRENNGVEEVHAVPVGVKYDRSDDSTYTVFQLKDLEDLVSEYQKYSILKVYVNDRRPVDQSLLRNGVVDICLIDAPGLNMDSYQTTQVFSRQEEIDLVVFVVSAENHFTLSAKEFIYSAANEKSLVFIVVNRFDNIRNKEKCQKSILDQVASLSPETHKDARDFVHFVSSSEVLGDVPDGNGGGDGPGDDNGNNGHEHPDFDRLEASLRNFVLEKRSLSKLMPAKTYLKNILKDLEALSNVNIQVAETEKNQILKDLDELTPQFEESMKKSVQISETMDTKIEEIGQEVYDFTKNHLTKITNEIGESPVTDFSSVFNAFNYAIETREVMIDRILHEVEVCEAHARKETSAGVNFFKTLGIANLGDNPVFRKVFNDEAMFSRRRDTLTRTIYADLTISDLFDLRLPFQSKSIEDSPSSASSTTITNALTLASVVGTGQLIRSTSLVRDILSFTQFVDIEVLKKLTVPALICGVLAGVAYVVGDIKYAVPRNVSRKLRAEMHEMNYIEQNAGRIARESRKVLKYPAQDVRSGFQSRIEEQARKKEEFSRTAKEVDSSYKYFKRLHKEVVDQHRLVDRCNLEATLAID